MKKLLVAVFCVTANTAWTQDSEVVAVKEADKVDLYVSVIENIDVTAEKEPLPLEDDLDVDIAAILDEAEALDDAEESE